MRAEQQSQRLASIVAPMRAAIISCRWIVPFLALGWLLCPHLPAAAGQASDGGLERPAHTAKKAPAAAATPHEARLPGDDIAMGMIARAKPSDKDNSAVLAPLAG